MSYRTTILEVGPEVAEFLAQGMAITFAGNAPEELRPFCFLIEGSQLDGQLSVGQPVRIGAQTWTITALGDVAAKNLASLGHVTLVFDGATTARMPGAIHLSGSHATPELAQGTSLVFGDD